MKLTGWLGVTATNLDNFSKLALIYNISTLFSLSLSLSLSHTHTQTHTVLICNLSTLLPLVLISWIPVFFFFVLYNLFLSPSFFVLSFSLLLSCARLHLIGSQSSFPPLFLFLFFWRSSSSRRTLRERERERERESARALLGTTVHNGGSRAAPAAVFQRYSRQGWRPRPKA